MRYKFSKLKSMLVSQTCSLNPHMKDPYTSMMETIYGEGDTAILIYQKYSPETEKEFNHALWLCDMSWGTSMPLPQKPCLSLILPDRG